MHSIMLAVSQDGGQVFRCNVGKVRLQDGRWFDTGLPRGHADLYGFRRDGQIFYIEVKVRPNRPTKVQKDFLAKMRDYGALAGVAYSVVEAMNIVHGISNGG